MLEGSILKQLVCDRADRGMTPLNYGVYYKNTLVALCHALEDCIITAGVAPPLVVTAFQRGKWYLQEADRYRSIAEKARQVVIMAASEAGFHEHPTSQMDNVYLVDIAPDDPVSQEWHLMILGPDYTAMVLCQELSEADYGPLGAPEQDLERKFYGFWTFDPNLVRETVELALTHVGDYDAPLQHQLTQWVNQLKQENPALDNPDVPELGHAVTQVVTYLQTSRRDLQTRLTDSPTADLTHNLASNELQAFLRMAQLVDLSDPVNPLAAQEVVALMEMMGQLLDLPAWRLQRLRLAGMLHRIAPAATSSEDLTSEAPSCPLVAEVQALRLLPRMRAVAAIIAHREEAWDGSGRPAGLAGDSIPLESRLLGLVSTFQHRVAQLRYEAGADAAGAETTGADTNGEQLLATALKHCQQEAGARWDPKLIEMLGLMVTGLQQGLSLPTLPTKITLGAGLLDPEVTEQIVGFDP
jgi:DICT domain-containing protein